MMEPVAGLIIEGGRVFTPSGFLRDVLIVTEGDKIVYVGAKSSLPAGLASYESIIVSNRDLIVPGFVDIHIHGVRGADTMDGTEQSLSAMSSALAERGTTSFLATTMTMQMDALERAVSAVAKALPSCKGASLLGLHLEGPFISEKYKGVQNPAYIKKPDVGLMRELLALSQGRVKIVTLAPEQPGALPVISFLREQGIVVSIGHSEATYDDVVKAVNHGLTHATHTFNGMRGFHHRDPGALGAVLTIDSIDSEIIVDLKHVHKVGIGLLLRAKGVDRLILVSDAMRGAMMRTGTYDLGGLEIQVANGDARMKDGGLAGTTIMLIDAIRNMVEHVGVALSDALKMATINPARAIREDHRKGSLVVGKDADIVILSEDLQVKKTIVGGKVVFDASK